MVDSRNARTLRKRNAGKETTRGDKDDRNTARRKLQHILDDSLWLIHPPLHPHSRMQYPTTTQSAMQCVADHRCVICLNSTAPPNINYSLKESEIFEDINYISKVLCTNQPIACLLLSLLLLSMALLLTILCIVHCFELQHRPGDLHFDQQRWISLVTPRS
jgi:hypothetical protein